MGRLVFACSPFAVQRFSAWRGFLCFLVFSLGLAWGCPAQLLESFEYSVPPAGWTKTNLQGGSGWYRLPIGVMPLPGWGNGTSSVPPVAGAGSANAYCTWSTGGGASEGYHNDQWLISPQLNGLTATSTLSYWLRFNFTNYPDTVYVRVSTAGPAPANFTRVVYTNIFAKGAGGSQFPPWSNYVVNLGALGIPAGTPIWVAFQEYEWDNTWNGAAVQLDVITSDLTAAPQPRASPTSLTFTAYFDGSNPAAQTFSLQSVGSSGMSYSNRLVFGPGPTNWLALGGPTSGTLAFQNSQVFTAGVSVADLDSGVYYATNTITVPGATNNPLRVPITFNVIRRPQTIAFPNPGPKTVTNHVGLAGTASSGLPVTFSVYSGPGSITGATNLTFTSHGIVRVIGWQLGNAYYEIAPSVTNSILVTKAMAGFVFTNMSWPYDGNAHTATVTTLPAGLAVTNTYNGSTTPPVHAGDYTLISVVHDALYHGGATNTFTITKIPQVIVFPEIAPQWTTNHVGLAATADSGLPVTFSVASGPGLISGMTNLSFNGAGWVSVVASQAGDANHAPAAVTNAIAVTKAMATVALYDLNQTYNGTARTVTNTTDPGGLAVDITYDGSASAPVAGGSYTVTGAVNDAMYQGSAVGTLVVAKAGQSVSFPDLPPRLTSATVALGATASSGLPVTEFSVLSGPGVIHGTNLTFSGAGDVVLAASQSGDGNWQASPAVTNFIKAFSVNPGRGPMAGGNTVLISNGQIGDGSSITNVLLCGVAATILDQGTNWVSVRCGVGTPGLGDLVIQADSDLVVSNAYTFNPAGELTSVSPSSGFWTGGYDVVLSGTNLCDGFDVTNVTINGVESGVLSLSLTQVVIRAGTASLGGLGDVRVVSTQYGETVLSNAFTYLMPQFHLLGTNGDMVANGEAPSFEKGTDFGAPILGSGSLTNQFSITNGGNEVLVISLVSTSGAGRTCFELRNEPSSLLPQTVAVFDVVFTPQGGRQDVSYAFTNDGTNSPFVLNLTGYGAGGGIALETNRLEFTATYAGADPLPQSLWMTNVGEFAFTYTRVIGYGAGASGWLSSLPGTGAVGPGGFILLTNAVDIAGVNAGVYVATNWVSAPDATNSPQEYVVHLTVARADQGISWGAINDQVTTNKVGLSATASSGLPVNFEVLLGSASISEGTNLTFSGAGEVMILAYQTGNSNWHGAPSITNTFTVTKAVASVSLHDLSQTYNGTARVVTATTVPGSLTVHMTYDGSGTAPIQAGSYSVTGVVSDVMWQGVQVGTLVVVKANQGAISFTPATPQTYLTTNLLNASGGHGTGLFSYEVVSGPGELVNTNAMQITSGTGTVLVRATKAGDDNWNPASVTGTVAAAKADQMTAIEFAPASPQVYLTTNALHAASGSGTGAFSYVIVSGPGLLVGGTNLALTSGTGTVLVRATKAEDDNWNPASVTGAVTAAKADQMTAIEFSPASPQVYLTTNALHAAGGSGTGAFSYVIVSGPGALAGGTNLALTGGTGTVLVRATKAEDDDWLESAVTGAVTAAKAEQAITFLNPGAQITTNVLILTPTASSGLSVQLSVLSGPADLLELTSQVYRLTFSGEGEVMLHAIQLGDSNWNPAPSLTNTFMVSKAQQASLVFAPATPQVYQTTNVLSLSGGSGTGAYSFAVISGPGSLVGGTHLAVTSGMGTVLVCATKAADALYNEAAVTGAVVAAKADQVIAFANPGPQMATNILPLSATSSSGLPVVFGVGMGPAVFTTTNRNEVAFTNTGMVLLSATQVGDVNWTMVGTSVMFQVSASPAIVQMTNLVQVYDGTAKSAEVSTVPSHLNVVVTYAGTTNWPVNAGSYSLVGIVQEPLYQGGATDVFTIARAEQGISFGVIGDQAIANQLGLAGTASSGLPVSFGVTGPAELAGGTNLSFTGTGVVSVTASQAGNTNWLAASNVVHVFNVYPLRPVLSGLFHADAEATTAEMGAVIENVYGAQAIERGIIWSTNMGFAVAGAWSAPQAGVYDAGGWTQQIAGLVSGITNYYRAYAVNAAGTGLTLEAWVHMKPEAPGLELASEIKPDRFQANWQAARGATNYWLDVSEDDAFGDFIPGYENRMAGTVNDCTVTGLTVGTLYHYRVRAENEAGLSTNSLVGFAMTAPRLTILTWPREAGQTIPEQGSYIVEFATPTQVVTWANPGYQFAYWEGVGGILVEDAFARTTTVTLLMNSVLTALYQQQASGLSWTYTQWKTNFAQSVLVGVAQVCNTATNGTRLVGPFWYCVQTNAQHRLRYPTGVDPVSGWPYVDVTEQIETGAGDAVLDPGECVQVTNLVFYTRNLKPPSNLVWQLRAVELPAEDRVDTDGDGIPDECEEEYPAALDPLNPTDGRLDFDKDGMPNDDEWVSGTDLADPTSFFAVAGVEHSSVTENLLMWPSATGRLYGVYWTSNALQGYQLIQEDVLATPPANTITDAVFGVDAQGFYQIRVRHP